MYEVTLGRKFTYDPSKLDEIIAAVEKCKGSLGQIADATEINRDNFYYWLRTGDEHRRDNISSEVAHLSKCVRKEQARVIIDMANSAFSDEKKVKFVTWWLSKICREDFGLEGIELKELRDIFKVLLPLITKGEAVNVSQVQQMDQ